MILVLWWAIKIMIYTCFIWPAKAIGALVRSTDRSRTRKVQRAELRHYRDQRHAAIHAARTRPPLAAQPPPALPMQAGWYPDPYDHRFVTWWDGRLWHPQSRRPR